MRNIGGDEPFGGGFVTNVFEEPQIYECTDRIMAFDVVLPFGTLSDVRHVHSHRNRFWSDCFRQDLIVCVKLLYSKAKTSSGGCSRCWVPPNRPPTTSDNPINWPNTPAYINAGLVGQMEGAIAWHSPTTENPALGSTEEWEIWNATGDAHPVHLHLVHFEVLGRREIVWDSATGRGESDYGRVADPKNTANDPNRPPFPKRRNLPGNSECGAA